LPGGGPSTEVPEIRATARWGSEIPAADKLERKLKRLRRIEAGYRAEIRRAQQAMKGATVDRLKAERKFERLRDKLEVKIERVQPKIKALTNLAAERKE